MKMSFDKVKRVGGISFEIALGVFLLAMLLNAWKSPESQASSSKVEAAVAGQDSLLPNGGTPLFTGCLEGAGDSSRVALFNTSTGAYQFCCGETTYSGVGTVTAQGSAYTISHIAPDRRVLIKVNFSGKNGSASIQAPPGTILCAFSDRNITDNTCSCGVQ